LSLLVTTVGISAYNEKKNISNLLEVVLNDQELPVESEVLVVCSGCTDNTEDLVQKYVKKDSRVKLVIEAKKNGKASAINQIFSKAKGKSIIFISADTLPKKGCFSRLLKMVKLPGVGISCANPVPVNSSSSMIGKLVNLLWSFHGHVFEQLNNAGLTRHATEVFCIRRGILDGIPSDTVNDDAYIALTAKKKGWLIKFDKKAEVSMCGPKTFSDYFNQRRRILFGHHQVKKSTGETPQHLLYLLPHYPIKTIKLLLWVLKKYSISTFSTFVMIELFINAIASFDVLAGRSHTNWVVTESTKSVSSLGNAIC
jgi:cellulose synthase/poly-beta-1,6-N-acetylglucosamine synthase-like glycosyltransferase